MTSNLFVHFHTIIELEATKEKTNEEQPRKEPSREKPKRRDHKERNCRAKKKRSNEAQPNEHVNGLSSDRRSGAVRNNFATQTLKRDLDKKLINRSRGRRPTRSLVGETH